MSIILANLAGDAAQLVYDAATDKCAVVGDATVAQKVNDAIVYEQQFMPDDRVFKAVVQLQADELLAVEWVATHPFYSIGDNVVQ